MAGKGAKATAAKSADKDKGKKAGGPVSRSSRAAPQEKSAPKKDVYQLFAEKVRDNKQLESRWAIMQETRVEYFRGKDFNTFIKNHPEVREILGPDKDLEVEDIVNTLLTKNLVIRCDRVMKTVRPGKKKLSSWPAHLEIHNIQGSHPPRSKRPRKIKTADDDQTPSEEEEDALQIQGGPPPRSKRPRKIKKADDDAPPGFSSCTTRASQIQISESTRRSIGDRLHSRSSSTLHWGAKRSRTALCRRDWSDLGDGPAGLIAERVLTTNGVIDFLRFRAVCRPWRRCSEALRTRALLEDSRLHPRGWIMLLAEGEQLEPAAAPHRTRRQFLNVSTGQCIQVDVPKLRDHGVLRSTDDDGLLLLLRKGTGGVCLLNPFTRQVAELPPITDGLLGYSPAHIGLRSRRCGGLVDGRWVFLYGHESRDGTLAFAKPGDERWVLVKIVGSLMSTMSFAGRFYGVTTDSVMVVDMPARGELPPRLVVAAKLAAGIHVMTDSVHLVDNGGELMLVHRRMRRVRGTDGDYKTTCKVYRVNLASGKATPASARGRAIFIGHGRALAVSPQVFPCLSANAVYPALNFDERRGHLQVVGCYHLRDGRTESWDHGTRSGLAYPWSIADCLAAYVSG